MSATLLGCPVQVVLLQMSCPRCHIPDALSQKSCQGCPAAVVLTWLSCPSWPDPATMTTPILKSQSFIFYHVMAPGLSLWPRLTCPGCPVRQPVHTDRSRLSCPIGPVLLVPSQPSCHGCPIPVVLWSCPSPVLVVMF